MEHRTKFMRGKLYGWENKRRGMTIIEIVIVIALLGILIAVGIVAMNPAGQLAGSRNNRRTLDLQTIMNGVRANIADQMGQTFSCGAGAVPTSTKRMAVGAGNYDIASCLVPIYLLSLPFDPSTSSAHYTSNSDYDTGYFIARNASTGQITLTAPAAELKKTISITR